MRNTNKERIIMIEEDRKEDAREERRLKIMVMAPLWVSSKKIYHTETKRADSYHL